MYKDNEINGERQLEISPSMKSTVEDIVMNDEALSAARAEELSRDYDEASLPSGFQFDDDGWLIHQKESNGNKAPSPIRICSGLKVAARTRDQMGENHGRLLEFADPDGVIHNWAMPMELLAGDGAMYRQELLSKGLLIEPGSQARQLLTIFIQTSTPSVTVRCVEQTGWNRERTAFVLQNETIGKCGKEPLILQSKINLLTTQTVSGSLADWQNIAQLCVGNFRLIFAMSAAFAPPLLLLLGMKNGGIHFRGGSSSGKTTCLRVAASVWGGPESVQQWRATANGLEGTAAAHNDCLLCLDEMGQIDPREIGNVAYMLANGVGKTRADKLGDSRRCKQWRLIFLSSGEIALAAHMVEAKQRTRAGQEVRVLDIPADGQKHGCFEELHDFGLGKDFAEHLGVLCKAYHGTAGPLFIRYLLPIQADVIKESNFLMQELSKKYVPANASGQVYRAFNRFALVAVAGELATTFGITGWPEGTAITGVMNCFNDWLHARGDMGPQEEQAILSQVRHFFEQHGDSRFASWEKQDSDQPSKTIMRVGFRKSGADGDEYFVFPESFKLDIAVGFDHEVVAKVCVKHGLLLSDSKGGSTRSERLPGAKKSTRVYRFTSRVLGGDE